MVTKDLDLCFLLTPQTIATLRRVLKDLHPVLRVTPKKLSFLEFPEEISTLRNLYLATDIGVVDIVSQITGVGDFRRVAERAVTIDIFGHACKVMAIEDLISAKKALGRPKDLEMVMQLEALQVKSRVDNRLSTC